MDSTGTIIDGEIKGSFLGSIELNKLRDGRSVVHPITENGVLSPIKVEGIWLYQTFSDSIARFIGVSDPDNGSTETYIIEVKIDRLN